MYHAIALRILVTYETHPAVMWTILFVMATGLGALAFAIVSPMPSFVFRRRLTGLPPIPRGHRRFLHLTRKRFDDPIDFNRSTGTLGQGFYTWPSQEAAEHAWFLWLYRPKFVYVLDIPSRHFDQIETLVITSKWHHHYIRSYLIWVVMWVLPSAYRQVAGKHDEKWDVVTAPWPLTHRRYLQTVFHPTEASIRILKSAKVTIIPLNSKSR